MRIFVTGGTGFVGSRFVQTLDEHDVTVLTREPKKYRCTDKVHYTNMIPDLTCYDMIYHLAGQLAKPDKKTFDYTQPHILLVEEIIEKANPYVPFVYLSTAYIDMPTKHIHYIETKKIGEQVAGRYFSNLAIVRPGPIFGPGDLHHLPLYKMIKKLGWWTPVQGGSNRLCPTHVDDVVKFLQPENIKYGLTTIAGKPVTIREFMQSIALVNKSGEPFISFPVLFKKDFFGVDRVFQSDINTKHDYQTVILDASKWYHEKGYI